MGIIIGIIAGIATSLGIGGGAILVLLLTLFFGMSQTSAQAVNLICYIPASLISIFFNFKQKNIHIKNCYMLILFGSFGAYIGSTISKSINAELLKKVFALFLLCFALYEIYNLKIILNRNKKSN